MESYCSGMSKAEAYKKAKYKGNPYKNSWEIAENPVIKEAIEKKLINFINEAEDLRKQAIIEARQKQITLMRSAESEQVQLNASKEIIADAQKINLGGQIDNELIVTFKGVDISKFPKNES